MKVIKITYNILLTIIIVVLSIFIVLRWTNKVMLYQIASGSMEDELYVGDYIIITPADEYKEGDVITYLKNDIPITHRLIEIKDGEYITRGDANNTEDEPIHKSDILGKLLYKSELLNFIMKYKYVLISLFLLLFGVSLFLEIKFKNKENN